MDVKVEISQNIKVLMTPHKEQWLPALISLSFRQSTGELLHGVTDFKPEVLVFADITLDQARQMVKDLSGCIVEVERTESVQGKISSERTQA